MTMEDRSTKQTGSTRPFSHHMHHIISYIRIYIYTHIYMIYLQFHQCHQKDVHRLLRTSCRFWAFWALRQCPEVIQKTRRRRQIHDFASLVDSVCVRMRDCLNTSGIVAIQTLVAVLPSTGNGMLDYKNSGCLQVGRGISWIFAVTSMRCQGALRTCCRRVPSSVAIMSWSV